MTQQNILDLKKYVEWTHQEICPANPIRVRILNKRYLGGGAFAAYHRNYTNVILLFRVSALAAVYTVVYGVLLAISPLILIAYVLSKKERTYARRTFRKIIMLIRSQIFTITNLRNCYSVATGTAIGKFRKAQLVAMAAHEVRHFVQFQNLYKKNFNKGNDAELQKNITDLTNQARSRFETLLAKKLYKKSQASVEIDSMLVEQIVYSVFVKEFPDEDMLTDEIIKDFILRYKGVLTTKYPESP